MHGTGHQRIIARAVTGSHGVTGRVRVRSMARPLARPDALFGVPWTDGSQSGWHGWCALRSRALGQCAARVAVAWFCEKPAVCHGGALPEDRVRGPENTKPNGVKARPITHCACHFSRIQRVRTYAAKASIIHPNPAMGDCASNHPSGAATNTAPTRLTAPTGDVAGGQKVNSIKTVNAASMKSNMPIVYK